MAEHHQIDKHVKHGGEKAMEHRRRFLKIYSLEFCDIWQIFSFHRILSNENFKMEDEFCDTFDNYSTIELLII